MMYTTVPYQDNRNGRYGYQNMATAGTVRVVTCGFSLINAYMCVVANVYWVMTYVTLTVIFLYDILVLRNDTKLKETFVSR